MKSLNVNVQEDLHRKMKVAAAQTGLTIRAFVRVAIIEKLEKARNERREKHEVQHDEGPNA